jgi:hypothetical protein
VNKFRLRDFRSNGSTSSIFTNRYLSLTVDRAAQELRKQRKISVALLRKSSECQPSANIGGRCCAGSRKGVSTVRNSPACRTLSPHASSLDFHRSRMRAGSLHRSVSHSFLPEGPAGATESQTTGALIPRPD